MTINVFTYGSLMFPEVWQRVVRGNYRSAAAHLDGHARYRIEEATYPGMIVQAASGVDGKVYFDVSLPDVAALDLFEGDDYRRNTVHVRLDSGKLIEAGAYIYLLPHNLSASPWLPEAFELERFIRTYCVPRLE